MARTPHDDPEAEANFTKNDVSQRDIGVRPEASFGGRSVIEVNNPDLGPDDTELERRKGQFDRQNRR